MLEEAKISDYDLEVRNRHFVKQETAKVVSNEIAYERPDGNRSLS